MDRETVWIITRWKYNPGSFVAVLRSFDDVKTYLWRNWGVKENVDADIHYAMHIFGEDSEFAAFEKPFVR